MAVLIKDMKMPRCCAECNFSYSSGGFYCDCIERVYIPSGIAMEGRPEWCPLEEVEVN